MKKYMICPIIGFTEDNKKVYGFPVITYNNKKDADLYINIYHPHEKDIFIIVEKENEN